MKQLTSRLLLLCTMACLPLAEAWSIGSISTKEKQEVFRFSKIKANSVLLLSKDFGNITITQWDSNEILLERKLTVSAPTAEKAEKKIANRTLKPRNVGNTYSFEIQSVSTDEASDGKYNVDDVWTVYVPRDKCSFDITNKFGDVTFTNNFRCTYLKADVHFGTLSVQEVQADDRCKIDVKHGSLKIGSINKATLYIGFTNVNIARADELNFTLKVSNMIVKHLDRGEGETSFSELTIASLDRSLELLKCGHGKVDVTLGNANTFENLSANSSFTDINLFLPDKVRAAYNIEACHGNIKIKSPVCSTYTQEGSTGNKFISKNSGYLGPDPTPKARMDISAKFANVTVKNK